MPYNNTGYPFRTQAGMGLGQGIRTGGYNDQRYSNNGNPGGAYNQQPGLGRYRPPTIQSNNGGQSVWNDQGPYEYNIPNSYGSAGNYFDPYQQNRTQYGEQPPRMGQGYASQPFQEPQQPQIYQRGTLASAFQQAQVAARNPNLQRPPMYSDTGGGYGQYAESTGQQTPRFQGSYGWRPPQGGGIRAGVPGGEGTGNAPVEVMGPLDPYVSDRATTIPKPRPIIGGVRPPSLSGNGFQTGPQYGGSGDVPRFGSTGGNGLGGMAGQGLSPLSAGTGLSSVGPDGRRRWQF